MCACVRACVRACDFKDTHRRNNFKSYNNDKLSRFRAMTKVQTKCLREFIFADDESVITISKKDRQQILKPLGGCLQGLWAYYQPPADTGDGSGRGASTILQHRRLQVRKSPRVCLLGLNNYPTVSTLRLRSTGASGKLPLHSPGLQRESGPTFS